MIHFNMNSTKVFLYNSH